MRFARLLILLALVLAAIPVWAQNRSIDVSIFATWVDPSGENAVVFDETEPDVEVDFDADQGWGVAVNVFWGNRISTEFAASLVEPELTLQQGTIPPFFASGLEMMPITAVLQFHFAPNSTLDPYIGAGGAYVLFDDIDDAEELQEIDADKIDFDDDVGLALNAGFSWGFTPGFGLYLDAKYVPVKSSARAVFAEGPGEAADIEVNPLIIAAGVTFKF